MSLAPHTRLGAYEIIGTLGAGGMGEVYRARDGRLGRDVALKVLPSEVTTDPGRLERFDREARAIAALNHPHIVTIFSTEEAEGLRFLTMELVEGQTLSEVIVPGGIGIGRFLEIAVPLADALTAAHQKQITHRDLKPGNVMVSHDGRVKVLDFGLARVGATETPEQSLAATQAPVTQQGMVVGTMPYMSPEQVEGRSLDPRSDLFSLGVIFYELLSGERPFRGDSSPALMSAILRDTPVNLSDTRDDVPDALSRLVARCLEKRPEERVQTARDVFNELRHLQKQFESGGRRVLSTSGGTASAPESLSVAVLPFSVRGADADSEAIATGITEDITASLPKFYGLSVVAPQSAHGYKDSTLDIGQIATRLNARYIIGGSVRKSGTAIRISVQLIDAYTGAQLWSETYDRRLSESDIFTIQDDVTDHIVATIADPSGILAKSLVQAVRQRVPLTQATARELVLWSWGFSHHPNPTEHAELRAAFEARVTIEPDNPHLWAGLAHLYLVEHSLWFNPLPNPLDRALQAARRAIELDPSDQKGWEGLAIAYFHRHDKAGLQEASDRAVRINPRNAHAMAWMGSIVAKAGDYDRGCRLIDRAMQINPGHPGWLHFTVFDRHFSRGEFVEALGAARRVNIRDFMWMHFAIAAAAGQLGTTAEGRAAYESMTRLAPFLADEGNLREFVTRWYWDPAMIESLLEGVVASRSDDTLSRPIPVREPEDSDADARHIRSSPSLRPSSGSAATNKGGLWVAVMPFSSRSGDEQAATLAEGLTDDITTGLSRFGNLRVLSRSAAERLAATTSTGRAPLEPPARYVLEGSVRVVRDTVRQRIRKAGGSLRVSVRLVDAQSGANLWADNYDRDAGTDTFSLQDDIASRVVATVGDPTGVLVSAMAASLADRPLDQLSVAELVVRFHAYTAQLRAAEHARLRDAFERALEREPRTADGWACLAILYGQEHSLGLNPLPDPLTRERRAAERAVELDPGSQQAWMALTRAHMFARDLPALRGAAERAVSINPLNADMLAHCAIFLSGAGDNGRALELIERAAELKPHHQGWYHFPAFNALYLEGRDEEALREAKLVNMPVMPLANLAALAAGGQLGRAADVRPAIDALRETAPRLLNPEQARREWAVWLWNTTLLDRLVDGLQRALVLHNSGATAAPSAPRVSTPTSDSESGLGSAFVIGVIPLQSAASIGDAAALADGLTQGMIVGLSRFQYLRVIKRRASADTIGTGYVLQGTVREAGGIIRVVVQLADAATGASLWADTYDRTSAGRSLFDLQDELTATIVGTIADANGALVRSMATLVRNKPIELLTPSEAVLRRFAYINVLSPAEHFLVREGLEKVVERAPTSAVAWAALAQVYIDEYAQGFNPRPGSLERARAAAYKSLENDASCQQAHLALAALGFFHRDRGAFKAAADRALALNPLDTAAMSWLGSLTAYFGDWDNGLALCARARTLNPHHPGIYWLSTIVDLYRRHDYAAALELLDRINMPGYPNSPIIRAALYGQLGRIEEGRALVREAEARLPGISNAEGHVRFRWFTPDLAQHIQEGLDKLNA
jgi:TolB-like protein/Tfp pilus assembly protein PilF